MAEKNAQSRMRGHSVCRKLGFIMGFITFLLGGLKRCRGVTLRQMLPRFFVGFVIPPRERNRAFLMCVLRHRMLQTLSRGCLSYSCQNVSNLAPLSGAPVHQEGSPRVPQEPVKDSPQLFFEIVTTTADVVPAEPAQIVIEAA